MSIGGCSVTIETHLLADFHIDAGVVDVEDLRMGGRHEPRH
jgi:hypothetical protein